MYQQFNPASMPGIGNSTYARGRAIWLGLNGVRYLPIGAIIASNLSRDPDNTDTITNGLGGNETEVGTSVVAPPNSAGISYVGVLRAGLLMGKITTVTNSLGVLGQYRNSIIAVVPGTVANGATTITLSANAATEMARLIGLGQTSYNLTGWDNNGSGAVTQTAFTAVSVSGTTLSISAISTPSSHTISAGAFIGSADGSQNPITFVDEQFGLNVVDAATGLGIQMNNYTGGATLYGAPFPRVPIAGGVVNVANIVNYPSAGNTGQSNLQTWIKSQLLSGGQAGLTTPTYGGDFDFSDAY